MKTKACVHLSWECRDVFREMVCVFRERAVFVERSHMSLERRVVFWEIPYVLILCMSFRKECVLHFLYVHNHRASLNNAHWRQTLWLVKRYLKHEPYVEHMWLLSKCVCSLRHTQLNVPNVCVWFYGWLVVDCFICDLWCASCIVHGIFRIGFVVVSITTSHRC